MISRIRLAVLLVVAFLLGACYHMRVVAEPIQVRSITTRQAPSESLRRINRALQKDLQLRVVAQEQGGRVLISAPRQFHIDTGVGQPAGGRKYFVQLQIEVQDHNSGSRISIKGHNFEIRTSYVYSDHGQLETLYKVYPYEEYPGMFNIDIMNQEMQKLAEIIGRGIKE